MITLIICFGISQPLIDDQWYTVKVLFFAYFDEDVGQRKIVPSKNGTLSNVKNHSVRQSVKSYCKGETDN
jgi:hypothetical protein